MSADLTTEAPQPEPGLFVAPSAGIESLPPVTEREKLRPSAEASRKPGIRLALCPETALHQSFLSLADQTVASATNFLTGVVVARACSKEEFGLYMLGVSLVLLITDVQTSLISTPFMIYAPRLKGTANALYTGSILVHQLALSFLTILALVCGAFALKIGVGPQGLERVIWALVCVIGLIMLREFARRVCFARLKLKTAFLFDSCVAIVQMSALLVLAHFGLLSASRAYLVIGSACGIAVLWWLWSDRGSYCARTSESFADLKKNWILGKWVFASGLLVAISMNIYPWLLALFHGTASAGVWAACLGVVSAGNPALLAIQNLVGPKIAHAHALRGAMGLRRLVLKMTVAIGLPMSFLCLVLIFWGDRLVGLLYGHPYSGNGLVVALIALNVLITSTAFPFSRALFAIERADLDFFVNFAALVIMLTSGLWLVRMFGPVGAATGLLAAGFVISVVRAGAFLRLSAKLS
jgi:O-antigen/teichoic acid export membrane protein